MKNPRKSTDRGVAWKVVAGAALIAGVLAAPAVASASPPHESVVQFAGHDWT